MSEVCKASGYVVILRRPSLIQSPATKPPLALSLARERLQQSLLKDGGLSLTQDVKVGLRLMEIIRDTFNIDISIRRKRNDIELWV